MSKRVVFKPYDITVEVPEGENLLRVALQAGVHINASCGGEGVCGKCRILLESGELDSLRTGLLSDDDWNLGYRQACQSRVLSDVVVRIPPESLLDRRTLTRRRGGVGLRPSPIDLAALKAEGLYNPAFKKRFVQLSPPTLADNINDLARLEHGLARQHAVESLTLDFFLLRKLARVMREQDFQVTATLDFSRRRFRSPHLLNVEAGDTTKRHFALAIDIGTTTVWVQLLDLAKGEILGHAADYNAQMSYGDDVITRIVFSQKEQGLQKLQKSVAATINQVMHRLLKQHKLAVEEISHITLAGNTTMTHLFYGIDPKNIRLSPYTPTAGSIPLVRARDLGLEVPEHVFIYSVSSVSSYVGGDIVSGVLASGIYKDPKLTLFIDIGTNGEIVIGNQAWLACAACSAGPAFEGGGIKFGMRATAGAIEDVIINPETFEPTLITIDMVKPKGIAGSGLINLMAAMMEADIISPNGKFREDLNTPRIRLGDSGLEYVLVYGPRHPERPGSHHQRGGHRQPDAGQGGHVRRLPHPAGSRRPQAPGPGAGDPGRGLRQLHQHRKRHRHRPAAGPAPGPLPVRGQRLPPGRHPAGLLPGIAGGRAPGGGDDDQLRTLRNPGLHEPVRRRPLPAPHPDRILPHRHRTPAGRQGVKSRF